MKIVPLSLAVLLTAATTEQCDAPVASGLAVCVAKAHKVHQSSGTPTHMTGKATVTCGQEATNVYLQVNNPAFTPGYGVTQRGHSHRS